MAVTGRMLIRWRQKTRAWSRSAFDWQGPCACDDLCQLSAAVLLKQSGILLSEAHWTSCVSSFSLFPHHHPHPPTSLYMLVRWCFILLIPFFFCLFSFRLQDPWLTGSSDFLTLPLSVIINALAPLVACVILDIRAALWRVDGWGGGAAGRNEGRRGWMIGGLERDEWGHPAVISLLFLPLLEPSFLFFFSPYPRLSGSPLALCQSGQSV